MGDVGSVCVAGRIGCAIRVENKPRISSGDRSELIRKCMARAAGVTRDTLCKALRKDGDPAAEHPSGRDESAGTEDPCRRGFVAKHPDAGQLKMGIALLLSLQDAYSCS